MSDGVVGLRFDGIERCLPILLKSRFKRFERQHCSWSLFTAQETINSAENKSTASNKCGGSEMVDRNLISLLS